jgi:hypothetical protein
MKLQIGRSGCSEPEPTLLEKLSLSHLASIDKLQHNLEYPKYTLSSSFEQERSTHYNH